MKPQLIFEARRKVVLWTELRHFGSKQNCLRNYVVFRCLENNPRIQVYIFLTTCLSTSHNTAYYLMVKKVNLTLVPVTKALRGSRGIALLFL